MKLLRLIIVVCLTGFIMGPVRAQQADLSLIPYRQGDLWGYVYPDKTIAIAPQYDEARFFVAGYAVVKKGAKYGYINKAGKLVIPFKFYSAKNFRYGYFDSEETHLEGNKRVKNQDTVLFAGAALTGNGVEKCINTKGQVMNRCPAINESVAPVVPGTPEKIIFLKKEYGFVNNGNLYDSLVDDYKLRGDEHTYYIAVKNGKYGVINNTFEMVIPMEYDLLIKRSYADSVYLQAEKNNSQGILNGNGTVAVPVDNNNVSYVAPPGQERFWIIHNNGNAMLRSLSGKEMQGPPCTEIIYDADGNGFVLTDRNNFKGYYFTNGQSIAPKYSSIRALGGGHYFVVVTPTGKTGYINNQGVEYYSE